MRGTMLNKRRVMRSPSCTRGSRLSPVFHACRIGCSKVDIYLVLVGQKTLTWRFVLILESWQGSAFNIQINETPAWARHVYCRDRLFISLYCSLVLKYIRAAAGGRIDEELPFCCKNMHRWISWRVPPTWGR